MFVFLEIASECIQAISFLIFVLFVVANARKMPSKKTIDW